MIAAISLALGALLLLVLAVLLHRNARLNAALLATRRDRDRLEHCVHHNCRGIRAHVAHYSNEAVAVCDALESVLQARCRVDLPMLERKLTALRRSHNAALLDAAGKGQP